VTPFVQDARSPRVVFGAGAVAQLPAEIDALGVKRALLLSTPGQAALAQRVAALLGERVAGVFAQAAMHVPIASAEAARVEAQRVGADGLVAVGGGSAIGLGKAVALTSALPLFALPTTYSGSEMTPIHGITETGRKTTGRDWRVLPSCVVYDPELTLALPYSVSVVSAINAIAHAAEGLYSPGRSPIVELMAQQGIRLCAGALPRLRADPRNLVARGDALAGAWLCGTVLASVTLGLHHKLYHVLGGSFDLPHAELHTVILPQALAYNAPAAPQAMRLIADALGSTSAAAGVFQLAAEHGAPTSLKALGMRAEDLDRAADEATRTPYPNPRPLDRAALRALLSDAYEGIAPR
jgi:maleylacetate reductase